MSQSNWCFRNTLSYVLLSAMSLSAITSSTAHAQLGGTSVKYFGYYGSNVDLAGVSTSSNVAMVYAGSSVRISQAAALNMKSIATLGSSGMFTPAMALASNYPAIWSGLVSQMTSAGLSNIAALYLPDEPYWNATLMCASSPSTCQSQYQVYNSLNTIIGLIRSTPGFESIPIAINFAAPSVNASLLIPPRADWIGFDCYGSMTNCMGYSIAHYISVLKSKLSVNQRLFAVPEGVINVANSSTVPSLMDRANLYKRIQQYVALIASEPRFIAVLPFRWSSGANSDGTYMLGVTDMPPIKQLYRSVGQSVLNRWMRVNPVYRFYYPGTGEHFFSNSFAEGILAGFNYEGGAFSTFANPVSGTSPIYRCYNVGAKHFVSRDPNCEGARTEGLYGYIYTSPAAGNPLYRWQDYGLSDYLETVDPTSLQPYGYGLTQILGGTP